MESRTNILSILILWHHGGIAYKICRKLAFEVLSYISTTIRTQAMAKPTVPLLLLCIFQFGTSIHAQFTIFRGAENLTRLQLLPDLEKLTVAAKTGETHILRLTEEVQGAVVQEDVTLNIDCLPWLLQQQSLEPPEQLPVQYTIRWSFIQLDEFGNVEGININ